MKSRLVFIVVMICALVLNISIAMSEKKKYETSELVSDNIATNSDIILENTEQEVESKVENSTPQDEGNVPSNNTIKSYMDYRRITSKNSRQYKLQHSLAYTDNHGIRMVSDRYCVALGSYYTTTIGQYVDIELANGEIIKGILADCKADKHTDSTNRINPNGSVVEFVVDTKVLDKTAKIMGDISYINNWNSKVVNIKVFDIVEKF